MAAKLEVAFAAQVTLVEGYGGVFDVVVDGERIYSKHETGKFPMDDHLIEHLRAGNPGAYTASSPGIDESCGECNSC